MPKQREANEALRRAAATGATVGQTQDLMVSGAITPIGNPLVNPAPIVSYNVFEKLSPADIEANSFKVS